MADTDDIGGERSWRVWLVRLGIGLFCLAALLVVYFTNQFLTDKFTESTRSRADVRLSL